MKILSTKYKRVEAALQNAITEIGGAMGAIDSALQVKKNAKDEPSLTSIRQDCVKARDEVRAVAARLIEAFAD